MERRILAYGAILLMGVPSAVTAQTIVTAITFTMPVNLTNLVPDVERVRFVCMISPSAVYTPPTYPTPTSISGAPNFNAMLDAMPHDELPVVAGQVVATMRVVLPIAAESLKDPIGKTADYQCMLFGFVKSTKLWSAFDPSSSDPALLLKPLSQIRGTFTWGQP